MIAFSFQKCLQVFQIYSDAGVVSGMIKDPTGLSSPASKIPNYLQLLISNIPLINKSFISVEYNPKKFNNIVCKVGQVRGSLFIISKQAFNEISGFDTNTFLYYEESILGSRLLSKKYSEYLRTDCSYVHYHSTTIAKVYENAVDRMKLMYKSQMYYAKHYLKVGVLKQWLLKVSQHASIGMLKVYWLFREAK
ncbi:glycosyltransferase [Bifidobacterium pullorum subsp. saeculare DSM 6531 = LMG 14934]|uniref:Glycosyltransferase n=1 Tax=Bifidobacterium pullorum subsp. saeculare DSM 6531 = LMG 14934 TaxID=1437611 RepID=A0A087CPG3_9BIFI|nr:glycosyltransferase [Bifidobacterium pullorum subsp. saeculare DSM 6531 = LMG 14934]